jgi:hypothetical protein
MRSRVPDAPQRLFGGAAQSRDLFFAELLDPGSAAHHAAEGRRAAQHPGNGTWDD